MTCEKVNLFLCKVQKKKIHMIKSSIIDLLLIFPFFFQNSNNDLILCNNDINDITISLSPKPVRRYFDI